jgi:membrane dipeptidase
VIPSILTVEEAREFHRQVCVIDLHADTAKLMDKLGYDLGARHERTMPGFANWLGHVDLPRMRDGGVAGQFFSFWTTPYPERGCAQSVLRQLDAIDAAVARQPDEVVWALTAEQIRAAQARGQVAALGGIEGGQALEGNLDWLATFARRGVRYLGLLHFSANALGSPARGRGADSTRGLTPLGFQAIGEAERCGIIVDLAHINRRGFFDALAASTRPPMVSHTGVLGVHQHWRNIDDEQVRAIADRGGCIGVIFASRYLGGSSIDAVVDHLLHIIRVAGDDVVALGSDFDGFVSPPTGLEDVSCLPNLTVRLSQRGVSLATLEKLLGGNVLRLLDEARAPGVFGAPHQSPLVPAV